jgi:phosphatidylglycerophosphate synthase
LSDGGPIPHDDRQGRACRALELRGERVVNGFVRPSDSLCRQSGSVSTWTIPNEFADGVLAIGANPAISAGHRVPGSESELSIAILTGQQAAESPLTGDLRDLGFDVASAKGPAELGALLAALPAAERVAVVDARFTGHRHALRLALTDPRFDAAAVPGVLSATPAARAALVNAARALTGTPAGPVAQAPATTAALTAPAPGGDPAADPGTAAEGNAQAAAPAAPQANAATTARSTTALALPDAPAPADVLPDVLAAALESGGTAVHRPELGVLVAAVPADAAALAAARAATAAVDEEQVRLRSAVKSRDGFFTTHAISPFSRYLARWCARRGLTPNQVTTASLLVALLAAASAATGTRPGYVAAGVLLLASFFLDCTDGQLARYALRYSTLGAWLDATFDRAKEYAYFAGLAIGAARNGSDVWKLALGAMILQTCRHVVDFAFNEANHDAAAVGNTSPTAALSNRLDTVGWTVWLRRMIVLPIGERWFLIAVLTAATTPRVTFVVLIVGCALAACYTTAGRVLRSLTRRAKRTDRAARALAELADNGPLAAGAARALAPLARRLPALVTAPAAALLGAAATVAVAALAPAGSWWPVLGAACYVLLTGLAAARPQRAALDWLVPPLLRAGEYGTALALAARSGVPHAVPAAFGLVAAVAYHHYDTVYRIRGGTGAPPRSLVRAIGGHEGRTLVVAVASAVFALDTGFTAVLAGLTGVLAVVVLNESIRFWVSSQAPAVHDETGEPA